ncbi:MAG: hypothetical protein ACKOC0_02800 [Cytophagales bacterium]
MLHSLISPGLWICYILLIVALVASVGMPLLNAIKHPADLVKSLIGVVGLVVVFGIAYAISDDAVTAKYASMGGNKLGSKLIGAGLITFYVALLVATALAVISLVRDIINN